MTPWKHISEERALPGDYYVWQLDRPAAPALPNSYFWTWDHSCNWVLDDPGIQNSGCYNRYFKRPETYVEDYRRLARFAVGIGVRGIVIWGFLRDAHGGIESARRVAGEAAEHSVAVMPGVGTTWYGGVYYEGDHRYNLDGFLRRHPDARMLDAHGQPTTFDGANGACIGHPAFQAWVAEALDWLCREFPIGGVNLENGDFMVDHHPLTQAMRCHWPAGDPEVFFHQGRSYQQALRAIENRLPSITAAYATYAGFQYCDELVQDTGMGKQPPAMLGLLPPQSVCQWTLSGMLLKQPLPLTAWLDDGAPAAAFDNPQWPRGLRPGAQRNVGFVHQGSQWRGDRYQCVVSWIKEACLRAAASGLEGVAIHGEVSARHIPSALNYLAFSHFIHWPDDTLRAFGRNTLGQVLGSERDGEDYAVVLAHWDAGDLTDDLVRLADPANHGFAPKVCASSAADAADYQRFRFWDWLHAAARNRGDRRSAAMPWF